MVLSKAAKSVDASAEVTVVSSVVMMGLKKVAWMVCYAAAQWVEKRAV